MLLASLLPPAVRCAEVHGDPPEAALLPEEEGSLGVVVPERRREFTTARHLARTALGRLGIADRPVPAGPAGDPVWPPGVVGSITHCRGYRAAAVASTGQLRSLGIDAENHAPLPGELLHTISVPAEREHLAQLRRDVPAVHWDVILFSAKEAAFKTWFPATRQGLRWHDACVTASPAGELSVRLTDKAPAVSRAYAAEAQGKWLLRHGIVLTAFTMTAVPENSSG